MKYLDEFSTLSHSVYALDTEKVVFVTFFIVFSAIFRFRPIRTFDLIEIACLPLTRTGP